jgi:hypothetical protein
LIKIKAMNIKTIILLLSILISPCLYANKVLQVTDKYQVRFPLKGLTGVKVGSVVKFLKGKKLSGEGTVIKVTEKTGYASIYKGKGKVKKGHKVRILEEFTGADKKKYVKRKLSLLGGIGNFSMGSVFTGRTDSPGNIDSFFGYQGEVNYRLSDLYSIALGVNKYGASKSVTIPAGTFVSNLTESDIVNGEISDVYLLGQYYFQRYPFVNSYLGIGYIPHTAFKVSVTSGGTTYEHVYKGTGIVIRAGREFVFKGNWMIALNLDFHSYSFSSLEDHNSDEDIEIDASSSSFNPSIMFGHNF